MKAYKLFSGIILLTALFNCRGENPPWQRVPHLAALQPAHQYFHIDPTVRNILKGERGSLFTIEPSSFAEAKGYKVGEKIEIEIMEVTRSLEFAALPVSLEFRHKDRETLFESAGMFYIAASYAGEKLSLKPGKKIKVKFRTNVSGDKFFVYSYDAQQGWQKHGHNHEELLPPVLVAQARSTRAEEFSGDTEATAIPAKEEPAVRRRRKIPTAPAAPAVAAPARPVAAVSDKAMRELYRVYEIDQLTWWNFDYPKPSLTCLKGTISGSATDYASVIVFSKSELGAYTLYQPKQFRISFYRNTRARLFAIDEQGNIARTATFETPNQKGHHKRQDLPCFDLGTLKMEKVPDAIVNDAAKLRSYLLKGE